METHLTKENKKQFEEWYFNTKWNIPRHYFYSSPFEMQIGVYLAYYDSLGYNVEVYKETTNCFLASIERFDNNFIMDVIILTKEPLVNTRNEAYKEAFKKADEIINGK